MSRDLQNICSRTKQKTRVEILKFESKNKARVELEKKIRVEKERTLTSCDINRCLHFTETRFRSKVVVCWLPTMLYAEFFFSLGRRIEDLESQLSSASYDSSEFLFRHFDKYKRTLATLASRFCETYGC